MKYEVRCCCRPDKLVGWLDWPNEDTLVRLFPLQTYYPRTAWDNLAAIQTETIKLKLDFFAPAAISDPDSIFSIPEPYKAIKAEDVPLETLKRIPGFIPNEREGE